MRKLSEIVRILDLDGSVSSQPRLMAALGDRARVTDLRELGPSLRYLCGRGAVRSLEAALQPDDRDRLTFIGSGDFHHVTASLLRQFDEPLTVIVFDRHSDWDRRPPIPCCGSWLADAVKLPHVQRIISVGLGKEDIGGWRILLGRVPDLLSGKVAFFPYDCPESRYIGGRFRWHRIDGDEWHKIGDEIIDCIAGRAVYLSVDKDCLIADEAYTNWEPGGLRVAKIVEFVERLSQSHDIVGADIVGEYSPIVMRNPILRAIARADHPRRPAVDAGQLRKNEETNLKLLAGLLR